MDSPKFRPHQLVQVIGLLDQGRVGEVIQPISTEAFGHPEPHSRAYEVSLAGMDARRVFYENELTAVAVAPIHDDADLPNPIWPDRDNP